MGILSDNMDIAVIRLRDLDGGGRPGFSLKEDTPVSRALGDLPIDLLMKPQRTKLLTHFRQYAEGFNFNVLQITPWVNTDYFNVEVSEHHEAGLDWHETLLCRCTVLIDSMSAKDVVINVVQTWEKHKKTRYYYRQSTPCGYYLARTWGV